MPTTVPPAEDTSSRARHSQRPIDYAKKYWWVAAVAVPIVVALINVLPGLVGGSSPSGNTYITNSRIGGDMYFNTTVQLEDPALREQMRQAIELAQTERLAESKALLEQVAARTQSAAVYNNLGVVRAALGDDANARQAYERALQIDPTDQTAHMNLGLLARAEGNLQQATEHLSKAPDYAQAKQVGDAVRQQVSNNTILTAAPMQVSVPVASRLAGSGDTDFFHFTMPDGPRDIVALRVENQSTTFAPHLVVFDGERAQIGTSSTTAGANLTQQLAARPAARYYIQVRDYFGNAAPGPYVLSATPRKAFDRFEPNDAVTAARDIGNTRTIDANVMDAEDADYYQFRVAAGPLRVTLTNRSSTLAPQVTIFDHSRSQVANHYSGTTGAHVTAEAAPTAEGVWYMRVSAFHGYGGEYSLGIGQ